MNVKDIFTQNGIVIQETSYTCGPAVLLNILRLKGDDSHTENELSKRCKTKPGVGTKEEDLVRVAKAIGIKVIEEKEGGTLTDIERNIDNGNYVIVGYMNMFSGEGHYAIITEYDNKAFYFRDPSLGPFRLKKEHFKKRWHDATVIEQWYVAVK